MFGPFEGFFIDQLYKITQNAPQPTDRDAHIVNSDHIPGHEHRIRNIALDLQRAWTERNWERVRPLESETLFQMHRYWIDAYVRQHLRNTVDGFNISKVEPVKITLCRQDQVFETVSLLEDQLVLRVGQIIRPEMLVLSHGFEQFRLLRPHRRQTCPLTGKSPCGCSQSA